jgi:Rad3-related DNA helicase
MALHLKIEALKNRRHVCRRGLESPTGTGKSAAIVCSVLAWQRHYRKMNQTSGAVTTATAHHLCIVLVLIRKWHK